MGSPRETLVSADADGFLTRKQAAAVADVAVGTIDRWIREHKLTKFRVRQSQWVLVSERELAALLTPRAEPVEK